MFTRSVAGAADNTVCYYAPRVDEKMGSHGTQLAKAVCIYSPWQFLYWYDKPSTVGDEPELEFFDHVPTVWDDKIVIEGEIGKYGTIARRSGDEWYIGSINGNEPHTVKIVFDFLDAGKNYTAFIYSDDESVKTRTKVKIEKKQVKKGSELTFDIKPDNGLALRIVPEK
jgi:alpha-glucosidase